MGAFSTLRVSRKAALAKLAEHVFGGFSNADLEQALDHRFKDSLRNFQVYTDEGADDEELEFL